MSALFKLINQEFSEIWKEWQWTYELKITFNYQSIIKVTITDHYQKKHSDVITNELILNLLKLEVNRGILESTNYQGKRKVFKWEGYHQEEHYRIIFWFENNSDNWLWIKDCYPI